MTSIELTSVVNDCFVLSIYYDSIYAMRRVHSDEKLAKLKKMRLSGHSIPEIMEHLSMPKTTVWHHVKNLRIEPAYVEAWKSKRGGGEKRLKRNLKKAKTHARSLLEGPYREEVMVIAALYWAEGTKRQPEFTNTDGEMIELYISVLRRAFRYNDNDFRVTLRIFTGMNKSKCLNYWSELTGIPSKNWKVRLNDGGTKSKSEFGMCRIGVIKGGHFLKVMDYLKDQIYDELV